MLRKTSKAYRIAPQTMLEKKFTSTFSKGLVSIFVASIGCDFGMSCLLEITNICIKLAMVPTSLTEKRNTHRN